MTAKTIKFLLVALCAFTSATMLSTQAEAAVDGAKVVLNFNGVVYESTAVITAAIATNRDTGLSYIEIVFHETGGGEPFTLRIDSASQVRIETFFNQLVTSVGKNNFQITAYPKTQDGPREYRATLESTWVYFIVL